MEQDNGRSPLRGSGSQASPEAGKPSSPSVSIPNAAAWWAGDNEEFFHVGPCATREDALGEALGYFGEDRTIYLLQAALADWSAPDASQIIDMMIDNSDDLFFEDGFPDMAGTKEAVAEAEAELNRLLAEWLAKYRPIFPDPTSFGWMGIRETVPASAMSAGTAETAQQAQGRSPASAAPEGGDAQ